MVLKIGFASELSVDSDHIRNFYAKVWEKKIALSNEKFYKWQFIDVPNNKNKDHCVIAYDDHKKEVLGVMGLNKRIFFLDGKSKNGAELTTWIVNEDSIGSGFGAKILRFIQAQFEVLIGMGISDMALPIYMRSGFRYVKYIPRFVKVINFESIKNYSKYDNLALKLIKKWGFQSNAEFYATEVTSENYTELFNSVKIKLNTFSRDDDYRKWRYDKHPFFKYKQYIVNNLSGTSKLSSYVALREELSLEEFKILHIIDLYGDDNCLPCALSFIERYAIDNGFDLIDFYCTASRIYRFMLGAGWFSTIDDLCFKFPHLFHPIEMRNPPTTSFIYWSKNDLTALADLSKLYVSKQDADLDRPTLHTINYLDKV